MHTAPRGAVVLCEWRAALRAAAGYLHKKLLPPPVESLSMTHRPLRATFSPPVGRTLDVFARNISARDCNVHDDAAPNCGNKRRIARRIPDTGEANS